jgi:hypothetical protein
MSQRIEIGETPLIEIAHCEQDLDVRGTSGISVTLSGDEPQCDVSRESQTVRVDAPGDCRLRVPEGASLSIGHVAGDLRLKRIGGAVHVDFIGGDCTARSLGAIEIAEISGSLHIKYAAGGASVGEAHGDVAFRGVAGHTHVGTISGDLYALDIDGGITVDTLTGDLSIRSAFQGEAHSRFGRVDGDAMFRLGPSANVRFVVPIGVEMTINSGLVPVIEGEHAIITFGAGLAEVVIEEIGGDLRIVSDAADEAGFEGDLDAHLARVAAEVDARLEETLAGVPFVDVDGIRDRVRRKMDRARRNVAAGRRDIHFDVGSSVRRAGRRPSADWERASDEERTAILQMVEEGRISVEQAEKLLSALEGEES